MLYKTILIIILSIILSNTSYSQTPNIESKFDIIHVVADGNTKLNKIYKAKGMPEGELRKLVFSTNAVLLSIRDQLSGSTFLNEKKVQFLKDHVCELDSAILEIKENMDGLELIESINKVKQSAIVLDKAIKKN